MPTYTYRCAHCGHDFDLHQRFDDPDPTTCPNCRQEDILARVYKPVRVVFKGSGFYATDNNSKSGLSDNGARPAATSNDAESSGGADKKPAVAKKAGETTTASDNKS